ncbi:hypothetical protein [Microbacterium sp. R86528]
MTAARELDDGGIAGRSGPRSERRARSALLCYVRSVGVVDEVEQ